MGQPRNLRLLALAASLLAAVSGAASASAGILSGDEPPKAELATTGNDSERLKGIQISKQPGKRERVAMSLGPEELKRIEVGDRMRASAEVQVSTTCVTEGPRCVGRRYNINPTISARIVLAQGPTVDAPAFAMSTTVKKLCKQRRPNRNHHCTLTIANTETTVADLASLPCPANACYLNLIVGAHNKRAKPGDRVVLGADRPDGTVVQDKGRLNLVQARSEVPAPSALASSEMVNTTLPLTEGKKEKRRVVHSVPIAAPKKGEVLAFDTSYKTGISDLRFNTFISSRVIVGETPTSTDPEGLARSAIQLRGDATEANGFNCTLGSSGYANPCTVVKAGAIRVTKDAVDEVSGGPATLHLNVVASAKPLLAEKVEGAPQVSLAPESGLNVLRYSP